MSQSAVAILIAKFSYKEEGFMLPSRQVVAAPQIVQVQRLVVRCVTGFLLTHIKRLGKLTNGDAVDGLIFCSVRQDPRSQSSALSQAGQWSLPHETARRRMQRLEADGFLARNSSGSWSIAHRALDIVRSHRDEMLSEFVSLVCDMRAFGYPPPRATYDDKNQTDPENAGQILDTMLIRGAEVCVRAYGSIASGVVCASVLYLNALPLAYDPVLAWRYAGADTPPPDAARRPASIREVARFMGMSPETVRRRLEPLRRKGWLDRVDGGYLLNQAEFSRPEWLVIGQRTTEAFEQALRGLTKAGVELAGQR